MPKRISKKALISSIVELIDNLRNLTAEQANLTDQELFEKFKQIYQSAAHLDRDELARMLPEESRGVFDVLYLGYTSRAEKGDPSGFSRLVKTVLEYPSFQRLAVLSEFNKSPEGYVYANLGNKVPSSDIVKHFSQMAPPLVRNLLNSLRAEEMGRFIGYLAASRMDQDIQRYEAVGGQAALGVSLETWLVDEIRAADLEFVVYCGPEDQINEATGKFSGHGADFGTREAMRPDHVILQYSSDDTGKTYVSSVHLGNSTSTRRNVAQMQGLSALTYLSAMINASHSTESELWGVPVRPYYFLYGLFCVDEAVSHGKNLSHALIESEVSREDRIALAQAHYLSMISCSGKDAGSYSPHPDRTLALLMHNPFISGCDTLDLHAMALEIQDACASGMTPEVREKLDRKVMNLLADKIISCANGLIQASDKLFAKEGQRNNTDSQTLVSSVLTLARFFPKAVRFTSDEDLKRREQVLAAVRRLGDKLLASGQVQWESQIEATEVAFSSRRPANDKLGMASVLSAHDQTTGMPTVGSSVFSEQARLREALRSLGDQLAGVLPKTASARRFLQKLYGYASNSSSHFVGLEDARVAWRKELTQWSKTLRSKRSKLPPQALRALELIQEHAFFARRPGESAAELYSRNLIAQQQLLEGLEGLGYGVGARPVPTKPRTRAKK